MKSIQLIAVVLTLCSAFTKNSYSQTTVAKGLEAILVVGPQEGFTRSSIREVDRIGEVFEEHGVIVHKFYDEKAVWEDIVAVAPRVSFFVYCGHGSKLGKNSRAGGICINPMVSTARLLEELKLKENALVVFKSVCRGAGSSADDDEDIGIVEAKDRVENYAYPFFEIGAGAYYANNYVGGCEDFLKDFLAGDSLKEAFLESAKTWTEIEFEEEFPNYPDKQYSIASREGHGTTTRWTTTNGKTVKEKIPTIKGYKIAYVGSPSFNIRTVAGK